MVIDMILEGLKDIFKNKMAFCLIELLLISISILLLSSYYSLDYESNEVQSNPYTAVPISCSPIDTEDILMQMNDIYQDGGYSWFISEEISQKYNTSIVILTGNMDSSNYTSRPVLLWAIPYTQKNLLQLDDFQGVNIIEQDELSMEYINMNNAILEEHVILIEVPDSSLKNISNYALDFTDIIGLIENTKFSEEDKNKKLDTRFEKIFENSPLYIVPPKNTSNSEIVFIFQYVLPYILLVILTVTVAFILFIKRLYQTMFTTYKIHMLVGATKKNIFIRNAVFTISLVSLSFVVQNILNNFEVNNLFYISILLSLLFLITFLLTTLLFLKKENLNII